MYFTRYVNQARISDIGALLHESSFIAFFRLGSLRPMLPANAERALELRMGMLSSPFVDCDKIEAEWGDFREALEHLGVLIEGLEDSRPFFVVFESERLRDEGAHLVPCRVAYVEWDGSRGEDLGEAFLAAFGEIYTWILSAERQASNTARRLEILNVLAVLLYRVIPSTPPDLVLQVKVVQDQGRTSLIYTLYAPTGKAGFHFEPIRGPVFDGSPDALAAHLFEKIETLDKGYDVDGDPLLLKEAEKELADLGQWLYRTLFPTEMRGAYRKFREAVQTIQITSDEPWIPWEMVKPFDHEAEPHFEDDFLCARFRLTRWLAGDKSSAASFSVSRLAVVSAENAPDGEPLPHAEKERQLLIDLAGRCSGLDLANLPNATFNDFHEILRKGGLGLLHFVGHGDVAAEHPNEAKLILVDRPFRPYNLSAELQAVLRKDRPLVFLNACRAARQGWSLSGLGGWAEAWVSACGCGAFLGPQWVVTDCQAYEFAKVFYQEIEKGETFGQAVSAGRDAVRRKNPGRPTWLAYAAYGHPEARLAFGES